MKRWIHASESTDTEAAVVASFGKPEPGTGCSFITPHGTFVNIYPKLDIHEDLCDWVEDELDTKLPYKDEEYFVREYGWIRLRSDPSMSIIEMPATNPPNAAWYALEDWLYFLEEKYNGRPVTLYITVCDFYSDTDVPFAFNQEYYTEDMIKVLKRFYGSGKIYAKEELENVD